jgi:hypothetical protein
MKIRKATLNDTNALTTLMEHLGYPKSIENMKSRFSNIESGPDYHTLLASYDGASNPVFLLH